MDVLTFPPCHKIKNFGWMDFLSKWHCGVILARHRVMNKGKSKSPRVARGKKCGQVDQKSCYVGKDRLIWGLTDLEPG